MRDTIKDEAYFRMVIEEDLGYIERYKDMIRLGEVGQDRVLPILETIYQFKLDVWTARYSLGEPVAGLVEPFLDLAGDFTERFVANWYYDSVKLLSLGILLGVGDGCFGPLAAKVLSECREDWLHRYLIHQRDPSVGYEASPLLWKSPYRFLRAVVEEDGDKAAGLRRYLEGRWYQGHRSAGWHDSHKRDQNTYYGYWSFEAGAVAKALGIDDSSLADAPYYPYDLVHFEG
jgi:hypothetical protein